LTIAVDHGTTSLAASRVCVVTVPVVKFRFVTLGVGA
jgi:hypothetical protein